MTSTPCQDLPSNPAFLGGPPEVFANISVPAGLAVDSQYLYVASYEIGPVYRVDVQDGTATQLDSLSATTIAINSTSVFTVSPSGGGAPQGLVVSCAKTGCGGNTTTLASGQTGVWGVAADDANVYWTNQGAAGGVWQASLAGGAPTQLATGGANAVVVGGGRVFYAGMGAGSAGTEGLYSVPVGGGAATEVTLPSGSGSVSALAVDCENAYYAASGGTVGKIPFAGGPPVALAKGANAGLQIAADGVNVYFPTQTAIAYVPVGGGPLQTIPGTSPASGIAVDVEYVYWSTPTGDLMRVGKPQGSP